MDFEKKYWSRGDFKDSDGKLYTGYVGISNGKAYIYDSEKELSTTHTWGSEFNLTAKNYDRILDDELQLPWGLGQV